MDNDDSMQSRCTTVKDKYFTPARKIQAGGLTGRRSKGTGRHLHGSQSLPIFYFTGSLCSATGRRSAFCWRSPDQLPVYSWAPISKPAPFSRGAPEKSVVKPNMVYPASITGEPAVTRKLRLAVLTNLGSPLTKLLL